MAEKHFVPMGGQAVIRLAPAAEPKKAPKKPGIFERIKKLLRKWK